MAGDAADAAPELMLTEERSLGSLVSSKVEMLDKVEEAFRSCKGIKDVNDYPHGAVHALKRAECV